MLVGSPVLWSGGNYLCAGASGRPKLRSLLSPPIFGILAGLLVTSSGLQPLLFDNRLPFYHIYAAFNQIGGVVPPLLLFCLGATIANLREIEPGNRRALVRVSVHVSIVRFLFVPALFFAAYFAVIRPLRLSPAHAWVIFLQMVVPPATSLSLLAARGKNHEDHVGFALLVTYILYIGILPLYLVVFLSLPGIMG